MSSRLLRKRLSQLLEALGVVAAGARALAVKEEDAGEVPRDVTGESLLTELEDRVRVVAVHLNLRHQTAAVAVERQVLGELEALEERSNLRVGKLLATKLVGRKE